jgi:hypothetical protein
MIAQKSFFKVGLKAREAKRDALMKLKTHVDTISEFKQIEDMVKSESHYLSKEIKDHLERWINGHVNIRWHY